MTRYDLVSLRMLMEAGARTFIVLLAMLNVAIWGCYGLALVWQTASGGR